MLFTREAFISSICCGISSLTNVTKRRPHRLEVAQGKLVLILVLNLFKASFCFKEEVVNRPQGDLFLTPILCSYRIPGHVNVGF